MKKVRDLVGRVKLGVTKNKDSVIKGAMVAGSCVIFLSGCTLGVGLGRNNTVPQEEYESISGELEATKNSLDIKKSTIDNLSENNKRLKEQVDDLENQLVSISVEPYKDTIELIQSQKSYYDMSDEEKSKVDIFLDSQYNELSGLAQENYKELYDNSINDRNSSKERIAKEEEEARKAAEEEAKRKVEEEARIAEQERIAQEQARVAQEQQSQEVYQEDTQTQMVWKSQSGKKYHSIPDCGNMNPNKATQIPLSSAQSQGLGKCSNCW